MLVYPAQGIGKLLKGNIMCKIAILERFSLFATGITSILHEEDEYDIIVNAESVNELIRILNNDVPHIIIFDILHSDNSGVKVIRKIRRTYPDVPLLLIVSQHYSDCFEEYIRLGVKGFIFNNAGKEELVDAINKLKNGEEYFTKRVWDIFKASIRARKYKKKEEEHLTDREMDVLKLFSQGMTYKEIGVNLSISPRTVETHKRNILSKLKINSTADMVRYAFRNHILLICTVANFYNILL